MRLNFIVISAWLVGMTSCAHVSPFEVCVRNHAEQMAATRVQAALACHGNSACIEESVIDDVQVFAAVSEQCLIDTAPDGGP